MVFIYVPQVLPLVLSFSLCLGLSVYGYRYRNVRGAVEFIFASSVGTLWALFNALELSGADLATKLVWANLQYSIYGFGPIVWLAMVCRFSEQEKRMSAGTLALLALMPTLTTVFVWLDPQLGLVRRGFTLDTGGIPYIIRKQFGPWYWIHYVYSQGVNLACVAMLVRAVARKGSLYRYQSLYILIALSIVYLSNLSYALGAGPARRYDVTPSLFCVAALIFWFGIFRHRLFELVPIARATVLERMANCIIVVDEAERIIDVNGAARRAFDLAWPSVIGKTLGTAVPALSVALAGILDQGEAVDGERLFQREIEVVLGDRGRSYELYASPLLDASRTVAAWVLMITDISALNLAREQIARQRIELSAARERENLSRELHDNLGQILSFAVIQSDAVTHEMRRSNYELAASQLERLREIVKDAHADLRGFVYGLRDRDFEGTTLQELVEAQLRDFSGICPAEVQDLVPRGGEDFDLTAQQKRQVSQILKESLNNIAKHASARTVRIVARRAGERFEFVVEDDGVGMAEASSRLGRGSGLGIMRERAQLLGGVLRLSSSESGGTRVCVDFPARRD